MQCTTNTKPLDTSTEKMAWGNSEKNEKTEAEGELPLISHFYAHCVCMPVQALHASPRGKSLSSGGKTCSSSFFFCSKKGGVKER